MPLAPTAGPYQVSTLTLEVPLSTPCTFHPDLYRTKPTSSTSSVPAFQLQTVLLTLFYPTVSTLSEEATISNLRKGTLSWLTTPRLKSIEGLLKYAGVSKYFALPAILPAYQVLFAKLPFYQNAPLAPSSGQGGSVRWPVAIFSHGLGGTAVTYSSYLASLASHGIVVAAVEHRDGTCPATTIRKRSGDGSSVHEDCLLYFKDDEVSVLPATKDHDKWAFRRAQLEFRRAELHEALHVLKLLNEGRLSAADSTRNSADLEHADLPSWQGKLEVDEGQVLLLGHSFGGATLLFDQLSSKGTEARIKAKLAILLDPWLEPLPLSIDTTAVHTDTSPPPPIYTINSQGFTVWQPHFERLKRLLSSHASSSSDSSNRRTSLFTLTGTRHTDFSDFPFLIPRLFSSSVEPSKCLKVFSEISRRAIFDQVPLTDDDDEEATTVLGVGEGQGKVQEQEQVQVRWERKGDLISGSKEMGPPGVLLRHRLDQSSTSAAL